MNLIIKETQYDLLLDKLKSNEGVIVCKNKSKILKESEIKHTKYTYTTLGYYNKWGKERYYFNRVVPITDNSPVPNHIKIYGSDGDFIVDSSIVNLDQYNNRIYIEKKDFDVLYPNFNFKKNEKLSEKIGITPTNIRKSLELAFPNNWFDESLEFTPGLRGIHPIGKKLGTGEDWSIMNYFDTKYEIHSLLYLKYFDYLDEGLISKDDDIVNWLVDLFTKDTEYVKLLVNRQWSSIEKGLKLERQSINNFINKIKSKNVKYYPHGSKMDRWFGIDVTVDGVNYQIKPLINFNKELGNYVINTYGMTNYIPKKQVNKIAFTNNDKCIIIDNSNYTVLSKTKVVFNQEPIIIE
jgi:hypothetical protein